MKELIISAVVVFGVSAASYAGDRELTFEDRVKGQEAIEHVYYRHQIDSPGFDDVALRSVAERKAADLVDKTFALNAVWRIQVTSEMVQAEAARMARMTRMPDRLSELFDALADDPVLVLECLARPALVDRLARNSFAFDQTIHHATRLQAIALRQALLDRRIDPQLVHPLRAEAWVRSSDLRGQSNASEAMGTTHVNADLTDEIAEQPFGAVGLLQEDREGFVIRVVLERKATESLVASYRLEKRTWDSWWADRETRRRLAQSGAVETIDGTVFGGRRASEIWRPSSKGGISRINASACVADDTWGNGLLNAPLARTAHSAVWNGSQLLVWGGYNGENYLSSGAKFDPATDTWESMSTDGAPSSRQEHGAVWNGNRMLIWGGWDGGPVGTGASYDPVSDSWSPISAANTPPARSRPSAVWAGTEMIVWGGYTGTGYEATGGRYNPTTNSWSPTTMIGAPSPRTNHTAVWTGTLMIIWGGYDGTHLGTGARYNPQTDSWSSTSTGANSPEGRNLHTAIWTSSKMVIWGGKKAGSNGQLRSGARYDPVTNSWTTTSLTGAPSVRERHSAVWTGDKMIIWGGYSGGGSGNTGAQYEPSTDVWTPVTSVGAPSDRYAHAAVWTGSRMLVWGGSSGAWPYYLDSGGRFDPVANVWTPTALQSPPLERGSHAAAWTGSLMVIWGGDRYGAKFNTGARYDPATDLWTPTATVGAPEARSIPSVVWTGSHLIFWGGDGVSFRVNTGGRYDPVGDTWAATSTTGAPAARNAHVAVWTGSRMLVWGGVGSFVYNSGGSYNPMTDQWSAMSTANSPAARWDHVGVWTGSRLVVWGGKNSNTVFNTGGRYDPVSDTWSPTSTTSAPSSRVGHTAIWTGSRMVVWGGNGSNTDWNNGARYDPVTDSWLPTSTVSTPTGRSRHTAIWTGSQMVVWGGLGGGPLNTGGRYDPNIDSWQSVRTDGAPSIRSSHTSVWTGTRMLVWGGSNSNYIDDGGEYAFGLTQDRDGDGYSECQGDCKDSNPNVHPGAVEICNGIDDDCNGVADDLAATCGVGACVRHAACVGGIPVCTPGMGTAEVCDSVDNDCNGAVDDDLGTTTCGLGACQRMASNCVGGVTQTCVSGTPVPENCTDGTDNDCDGNPDGMDTDCASTLHVRLKGLEVVQVVQDWQNSIPLIAGKQTAVRAYFQWLDGTAGIPASVRLRGIGDPGAQAIDLGTRPPDNPGAYFTLRADPETERGNPGGSVYFVLPDPASNPGNPWLTGAVKFRVEGTGVSIDCGSYPDCSTTVAFQAVPPIEIKLIGITYRNTAVPPAVVSTAPSPAEMMALRQDILSTLPVAQISWSYVVASRDGQVPAGSDQFWNTVLDGVDQIRRSDQCFSQLGCKRQYLGVVSGYTPGDYEVKGQENFLNSTAAYYDSAGALGTYGRGLATHELGHALGRIHPFEYRSTPVPGPYALCSDELNQQLFPEYFPYVYDFGGMTGRRPVLGPGMPDRSATVYGVDFARTQGRHQFAVADPFVNFDVMSYCGNLLNNAIGVWEWPSKYTYTRLLSAIGGSASATGSTETLRAAALNSYMVVSGKVNRALNTVRFDPVFVVPSDTVPLPVEPGSYQLRFEVGGTISDSIAFEPVDPAESNRAAPGTSEGVFEIAILDDPSIDLIEVLHNGEVIGNVHRSAQSPVVHVVSPNGGEVLGGATTVAWGASDPDGDLLTATVDYSNDAGASWRPVATGLTATQYDLDLTALPGGVNSRVRVRVTDGFHAASDESDTQFAVPKKGPSAVILGPIPHAEFTRDQSIFLRGVGSDLEDGDLPDAAYEWLSSVDGLVGTGADVTVSASALSEATHVISLVVKDSDNMTSTVQRTITITRTGFPSNTPPLANAGPDRTVTCAGPAGTSVILDGSASSDANGDPLIFTWSGPFLEGGGIVSGSASTVTLPVGIHTISLAINDGFGGLTSDLLQVTVTAPPETCNGIDDDCDGVEDNVLLPPAVGNVILAKTIDGVAQVGWPALPQATGYDVVRGDLIALRGSSGDFTTATNLCLGNNQTSLSVDDADVLVPGGASWYLARALNCTGVGTYDSGAASQTNSRDSAIAGSAQACP